MSRSALWRQDANVRQREQTASDIFSRAVEEGKQRNTKGLVPHNIRDDSFNMNPMLLNNIKKSPYFHKCCDKIEDWSSLVDEIYYEVKHMEPWTQGAAKSPSTAFCLLLRLLTLRCSEKQMKLMLDHVDSPYIRCIGFLYLRYVSDPSRLWDWVSPYLYDKEPVQIVTSSKRHQEEMTVGGFVRSILTELDYMGTRLPRLPVSIEREMKVKLLEAERIEERATSHTRDRSAMNYFQTVGSRIRALYGDEENPVTWYDAVVDRVVRTDEETGIEFARPKFLVTFPEYGNTELVTLGEIDMRDGGGGGAGRGGVSGGGDRSRDGNNRKRDRNERDGEYYRDHRNDQRDLMEEVRRRERESSAAKGKAYASRPATFKETLSGPKPTGGGGYGGSSGDYHSRSRDYYQSKNSYDSNNRKGKESGTSASSSSPPPQKQKTPEEMAAIAEKKRKLMAKYG